MAKPDTIIVDGHAFSWQQLCELRRQQLEAWRAAQASSQPCSSYATIAARRPSGPPQGATWSRACWTASEAAAKRFSVAVFPLCAASIGSLGDATFTPSRKSRKPPNSTEAVARERADALANLSGDKRR